MLVLGRKSGQRIIVDDDIAITVLGIEFGQVRIGIDAPDDVSIWREEIYNRLDEDQDNGN